MRSTAGGAGISFSVLGPLAVTRNDNYLKLGSPRQRAVLGFLALHNHSVISMSRLLDALWPEQPPRTARKIVQNAICSIRSTLNSVDSRVLLLTDGPGYVLHIADEAYDMEKFRSQVEAGRSELRRGNHEYGIQHLRNALSLWRGPALSDLVEYGFRWPEITALQNALIEVYEERIEAELDYGQHREIVGELAELVAAEPLNERLCGQLMLALYRCDRQMGALEAYRRIRKVLGEEAGIEPGRRLQDLELAVLRQDPVLDFRRR